MKATSFRDYSMKLVSNHHNPYRYTHPIPTTFIRPIYVSPRTSNEDLSEGSTEQQRGFDQIASLGLLGKNLVV